jgi:rhomboid protease GluP
MEPRPKGWRYLIGTWSGRLLLVNTAVFLYITVKSGSLLLPDTATLLSAGAKDPVLLCQGQPWRFFLPMFIHIGILHFAVNSYMLYVIGYQLEQVLGGAWFLGIYLAAGVLGNIGSSVFSVNMSAGASSSLFGLLGAGLLLEVLVGRRVRRATGQRPRNSRAYLMTVLINLAFGMAVPFVDNSAHMGGLVAGTMLTFAMVNLRPNRLQRQRPIVGTFALVLLVLVASAGAYLGTSPVYVGQRLAVAADRSDAGEEKIYRYTQALALSPNDPELHLKRARELFAAGEAKYAYYDVREVIRHGGRDQDIDQLADDLEAAGRKDEAWQVRRMVAHGPTDEPQPGLPGMGDDHD